jgi:UDP-glucuronate 4-epimerase
MKILITGSSGFIGFNLALKLLKKKSINIVGIDNHDNYYSVKLKNKRLNILKKYKNFSFKKIDISKRKQLMNFLKNKKFDYIFHFAAQAGVRFSFENPYKYIETNINGFVNLTDAIKNKPKKFFYASSSSVYGDVKKFPVDEKSILVPRNIYGMSKVINEDLAKFVSQKKKINFVGLRFYTVFGPWGRPDMFLMKIFKCIFKGKTFLLNNKGNHERDFTFIDDITNIMILLMKKKLNKHQIFNISSNKPQNILKIAGYIKKNLGNYKMNYIQKHSADVLKTHGENKNVKKITNYKSFKNIYLAIDETFEWYKKNNIYEID